MKKMLLSLGFTAAFGASFAQTTVNATPYDNWIGWMNVFQTPANGSGYVFGSQWDLPLVRTDLDSVNTEIVLYPNFNTYDSTDFFWTDSVTFEGNKWMEASTYVEPGAGANDQALTFKGSVASHTLDTSYTAYFFIKALDPANNYSDALAGSKFIELPMSGDFSVSATAAELPSGLIVQYGFAVLGKNANPESMMALGNVVITPSTTGFGELNADEIRIAPNPANDFIEVSGNIEANSAWTIVDAQGRVVKSGTYAGAISIADLESGVYFFQSENSKSAARFVRR